jgi:hypothetical protein
MHRTSSHKIIKPPKSITQEEFFEKLSPLITNADMLVGHKPDDDVKMIRELFEKYARPGQINHFDGLPAFCAMFDLAKIIGEIDPSGNPEKWLKLEETYEKYFPGEKFKAHAAYEDAKACLRIFLKAYELKEIEFG